MSEKTREQIIGEFVIWLEENGNNLQQTMAYAMIENAKKWHEFTNKESDDGPQ